MQGLYKILFPYIVLLNKTNILGKTTFIAAIINLIATYVLIKLNGPIGAAQATFLAYSVSFLFVFVYTIKRYPMPWFFALRSSGPQGIKLNT